MKLKFIILSIFLGLNTYAQKEYNHKGLYASAGYEIGLLSVDLIQTTNPFENIDAKMSLSHSGIVSAIYKTPFNAEIKGGYKISYNSLGFEGIVDGRSFDITNTYYSHTTFIGAGYNIPIKEDIDITVGLGSALSFIQKEDVSEKQGDTTDYILVTNNSFKRGNAFIIPELSVSKYLKNGDFISFGGKYYHSVSDYFLNGMVFHNGLNLNQTDYETQNNGFAIYLIYGFKLIK